MESTFVKTDATLEKTKNEVAAVLLHLKRLLRLKNRLCSPLLRLPTETIVHILSYIMENMEFSTGWEPIFSTCHHIHNVMRTATELWWKANFSWTEVAKLALLRSQGCPQTIIADLQPWDYWRNAFAREALDFCRDELVLHGHRLDTLELCGEPSDITHFSWIFERPLPRLDRLKIHFFRPLDEDETELPLPDPVPLQLPADLRLRVLDLRNAILPWSSNLFTGLSELHLDFTECDSLVEISEEELLGIFDASPRLERLSLVQVEPRLQIRGGQPQFTPARTVRFPRLTSLKLDHFPEYIRYVLARVDVPAIVSLEIRSQVSPWEVEGSLGSFFPDDRLPNRLFPNPPVFEIGPANEDWPDSTMNIVIGGVKMWFDFNIDEREIFRDTIMNHVLPLVPPSVTILKIDDSKSNWRKFFRSHPEVRSIEPSKFFRRPMPKSLWDALSPAGADTVPLCPNLESITLWNDPVSTPLLNCLLNRKNAGFGLRNLKMWNVDDRVYDELRLLVEVFQGLSATDPLGEEWELQWALELDDVI